MNQPSNFSQMLSHPNLVAGDKVILSLFVRMDDPKHDGQILEPELSKILRKMRSNESQAAL